MRRPLLLLRHRMLRLQSKGLEAHTRIGRMYVPFTSLVEEDTDIRDGKMRMRRDNGFNFEETRKDQKTKGHSIDYLMTETKNHAIPIPSKLVETLTCYPIVPIETIMTDFGRFLLGYTVNYVFQVDRSSFTSHPRQPISSSFHLDTVLTLSQDGAVDADSFTGRW